MIRTMCLYSRDWKGGFCSYLIMMSFFFPTITLPCSYLAYDTRVKEGGGVTSGLIYIQQALGQKKLPEQRNGVRMQNRKLPKLKRQLYLLGKHPKRGLRVLNGEGTSQTQIWGFRKESKSFDDTGYVAIELDTLVRRRIGLTILEGRFLGYRLKMWS